MTTGTGRASIVAAALAHGVGGLVWGALLGGMAYLAGGRFALLLWLLSAFVLWVLAFADFFKPGAHPWRATFAWWCASFVAPFVLAARLVQLAVRSTRSLEEAPMNQSDTPRVDRLERRVDELEEELHALSALVVRRATVAAPPPAAPALSPARREPKPEPTPAPFLWEPSPSRPTRAPSPPRKPREPRFTFDPGMLFGARSLAITGGIVTLLGILFFFVLAVNRGWIGPSARVALGAIASSVVFSAGVWLRRRFGDTHSAFAAVGVGIAGGYGTLLAATALYGLLPTAGALFVAVGIAIVATATALVWRSELVASLGLIGAALAPLAIAAQDGLSTSGTAFAAIVFAAIAAVAVLRRWRWLLLAGAGATVVQIGPLVAKAFGAPAGVVALAAIFSLLYLASGIAWHLRHERRLSPLSSGFAAGAAWLAAGSSLDLWTTTLDRGVALLVVAGVLAAASAAFFRGRTRDLSALLAAAALAVCAVAVGELLSGRTLTYAWAGEAAALAWLSRRVRELRYRLYAFAYLGMAAIHAIAFDAPPRTLFREGEHPGVGALAVVATMVAAGVLGSCTEPSRKYRGAFAPLFRAFQRSHADWREASFWFAGLLAAYAAALGLVQLFVSAGAGFDWGHVAVDGVWAGAALAIVLAGLRRGSLHLLAGGFAWLGATALIAAAFDVDHLGTAPRSVAFLLLGAAGLATGLALERQNRMKLVDGAGVVPAVFSLGFALGGAVPLAGTEHLIGASLLGLAAIYGAVSALLREKRDVCTLHWAIALVLGGSAVPLLLDRTWVVLAWAVCSAAVSVAAVRLGERRLQAGALAYLVLALGDALILRAPPNYLFTPHANPIAGVPALLLALAAAVVFGRYVRHAAVWWTGGVVALYAASLSILELVEKIGAGSLDASFHGAHSAISALWGVLGLVLLYAGLTRRPVLRVAGFALFAVSLAKLFLFDLPSLSPVTRALSFLAVGAVLLLGGFFYQRLLQGEPSGAGGRARNA